MRIFLPGEFGAIDPRMQSKAYPDVAHFVGGAFVARASGSFAGGSSGTTYVELWKTPVGFDYLIDGIQLELTTDFSQSGTPADMTIEAVKEREASTGLYLAVTRAKLRGTDFSGGLYSKTQRRSSWGMRDFYDPQILGSAAIPDSAEVPHRAYDGRVPCTCTPASDILTSLFSHGMPNDTAGFFEKESGATLPAELNTTSRFFVVERTDYTFKVASSLGGAAINLTTAGSGNFYFSPTEPPSSVGRGGIFANSGGRFQGCKVALRATNGGANTYSGTVQARVYGRTLS